MHKEENTHNSIEILQDFVRSHVTPTPTQKTMMMPYQITHLDLLQRHFIREVSKNKNVFTPQFVSQKQKALCIHQKQELTPNTLTTQKLKLAYENAHWSVGFASPMY